LGSDASRLRVGDICAVEPYLECGTCIACRRGKTNCCATLRVLGVHIDGGMRELIHVPIRKLHSSTKLSLEQLALVETLGIGAHAVERAQPERGEDVLVIGAGPIGLAVIQFATIAGANVRVLEINPDRSAFCRKHFGIKDLAGNVSEIQSHELPTLIFDATGNPTSMMGCFNIIAPGGKLVFVGLFQGDVTFHDPLFHRREMTILSSRNARSSDFTRIIGLMESGRIDTRPWITHQCMLEEMPGNFESWLDPKTRVVKAMVSI
jgi:2-desacetyl-2-hydroxyethyl bacteriochlorophyllide A dehydrogenase